MSIDITFRDIDRNDAGVLMDIYELMQVAFGDAASFSGQTNSSLAYVVECALSTAEAWDEVGGHKMTLGATRRLVAELERIEKAGE